MEKNHLNKKPMGPTKGKENKKGNFSYVPLNAAIAGVAKRHSGAAAKPHLDIKKEASSKEGSSSPESIALTEDELYEDFAHEPQVHKKKLDFPIIGGASGPNSPGRMAAGQHPRAIQAGMDAPIAGGVLPDASVIDPLSSPDAEFEICGWLLRLKQEEIPLAERLFDLFSEKDISHPTFRGIVQAAKHYVEREEVPGLSAVIDYGVKNSIDVGDSDFLSQVISDPLSSLIDDDRLHQDVDLILDYSARRKMRKMLQCHIDDLTTKPLVDIVRAISDDASSLQADAQVVRTEPVHISEIMDEIVTGMFDETPSSKPVSSGYDDIDQRLNGGFRDGDLVIVAGRPAMGKTAFAIGGLARNASLDTRHRRPVLVFSLEMTATSLGSRILSSEAGIPAKYFRSGEINSAAFHESLAEVLPRFSPLPDNIEDAVSARLWIDDTPGLTLADVRARSRQFARQYGRPLIIIDYLQLLASAEADHRAVGAVSTGLKQLARELNTPIIALSQLNRSLESRTNKQPIMSDLRESGNIEQDADIIMFLYRDVVYHPDTDDPERAIVIIGKQREGENGPVMMRFNSQFVRYENYMSGSSYAADMN